MSKKKLSKSNKSLLLKILDTKGEPVDLIYYAVTLIAEKYELTNEQVISIIMNLREDIHKKALKTKFERTFEFEEIISKKQDGET